MRFSELYNELRSLFSRDSILQRIERIITLLPISVGISATASRTEAPSDANQHSSFNCINQQTTQFLVNLSVVCVPLHFAWYHK